MASPLKRGIYQAPFVRLLFERREASLLVHYVVSLFCYCWFGGEIFYDCEKMPLETVSVRVNGRGKH